jgi:hypothetical protein
MITCRKWINTQSDNGGIMKIAARLGLLSAATAAVIGCAAAQASAAQPQPNPVGGPAYSQPTNSEPVQGTNQLQMQPTKHGVLDVNAVLGLGIGLL